VKKKLGQTGSVYWGSQTSKKSGSHGQKKKGKVGQTERQERETAWNEQKPEIPECEAGKGRPVSKTVLEGPVFNKCKSIKKEAYASRRILRGVVRTTHPTRPIGGDEYRNKE